MDIDYNRELFQSVAENSIKELKRREDETSIPIVDFIQNNQSSTKLFHVMNHPVNALLLEYSRRIAKAVGLNVQDVNLTGKNEFLGQFQTPLNPYSKQHLNCQFDDLSAYRGLKISLNEDGSVRYEGATTYSLPELIEVYYRLYDAHHDRVKEFLNK